MSFSLIPDYSFNKITDISAEFLAAHNIDFLMLDMDNTISPYRVDEPDNEVRAWAKELKNRGITLFIVSNSKRVGRTEKFAQELSVSYIKHAKKP